MRFSVEAWAPEYGAPISDGALEPSGAAVNAGVEVPPEQWTPRAPEPATAASAVLFVDGVRRIEARVWIGGDEGAASLGICATYAAGACRCDGLATIVDVEVERALLTAAGDAGPIHTEYGTFAPRLAAGDSIERLTLALQQRMSELEARVAQRCASADLVVVDGPLRGSRSIPNAIGYIKTHRVGYLPPVAESVVSQLGPGERTPLFLTSGAWSLFSWYLRLPGPAGHAWANIVRCEADADLGAGAARTLADRSAATLPAFASRAHKDPRAPQNLYPIAGLERELRRRSGDPALLYRGLVRAASRDALSARR